MTRLSERDWLNHGLKTLAASGFTALKAASLAQALGVSRGSFYWHFQDITDFHARLLTHWQSLTTDAIIQEMEAKDRKDRRLTDLIQRAFLANPQLDQAVRAWADHDEQVRAHLKKVDKLRLGYIRALLEASGLDGPTALQRARFLYAASLGDPVIAPGAAAKFSKEDLEEIAALLVR